MASIVENRQPTNRLVGRLRPQRCPRRSRFPFILRSNTWPTASAYPGTVTALARRDPEFSHRQIMVIIAGLMTGMMLAALDQSIVGTALPQHRQRSRWTQPPRLGGHRLPADLDRRDAAVGQDFRPLRPADHFPDHDRHLPDRLGAVWPGPEHAAADRLPGDPGHRWRWPDGDRLRDHRRRDPGPRAWPLPGLFRRGVRRFQHCRSAARRLDHRHDQLALDLLHQPPARHLRPRHHLDGAEDAGDQARSQDRLPRRVGDRGRRDILPALPQLGG